MIEPIHTASTAPTASKLKIIIKKKYNTNSNEVTNRFTSVVTIDPNVNIVKPILKWVGGKTQILDKLIAQFPTEMDNYHEIFLGGGSVLLAFLSYVRHGIIHVQKDIYAYDINLPLIHMYQNIQNNHNLIYQTIQSIIKEFQECHEENIENPNRSPQTLDEAHSSKESYYYWIRSQYNHMSEQEKNSILGSSLFIFLNKTCFRGLFRIGPNGFNVPYGNYKNPKVIEYQHLSDISDLIKNVKFLCLDFKQSLGRTIFINSQDFVYLDPPYAQENDKSFTKYTENGFNKENHIQLFAILKNLESKFLLSNADVSLVRENFHEPMFNVESIVCKRTINSKKPNSKTNEIMIRNYKLGGDTPKVV